MEEFSKICDLEIDRAKLCVWATDSASKRTLKAGGFTIQLDARDLGGQANYSAKSHVRTIVDRIDGVRSCFADLRSPSLGTWRGFVAFPVLCAEQLDPEFFQLWRSIHLFPRQCCNRQKIRSSWSIVLAGRPGYKVPFPKSCICLMTLVGPSMRISLWKRRVVFISAFLSVVKAHAHCCILLASESCESYAEAQKSGRPGWL